MSVESDLRLLEERVQLAKEMVRQRRATITVRNAIHDAMQALTPVAKTELRGKIRLGRMSTAFAER